jgi:AbrB family looped-hinge helix DNA binding protein
MRGVKGIDLANLIREKERIQTFDRNGRVYIPKEIREQFRGCYFYITVEDGKIVLDPIKIE